MRPRNAVLSARPLAAVLSAVPSVARDAAVRGAPPAGTFAAAAFMALGAALAGPLVAPAAAGPPDGRDPVTVHVFWDDRIHFNMDDPGQWNTETVKSHDNGREIARTVTLPDMDGAVKIVARVTMRPIANAVNGVHDKWDRAAHVRLVREDAADIEVVKLVTAYGGETHHDVDVSQLAPLLRGECEFRGWVDTWVSPAWKMDFELVFYPLADEGIPEWLPEWGHPEPDPAWVEPLVFVTMTDSLMRHGDVEVDVDVPEGTTKAVIYYLSSGHCTDGTGADEFQSKDNVMLVDGEEVHRYKPWREDCKSTREINPYCRRWYEGSWSADFSRSGWCPGLEVLPEEIDATEALTPGRHTVGFRVEDIRPRVGDHHGYWRVSAYLVGWTE